MLGAGYLSFRKSVPNILLERGYSMHRLLPLPDFTDPPFAMARPRKN
jgi:hypothetical protein